MNLTCLFFGIIFIVSGLLFALGIVHPHLNFWKSMPDAQKDKINIKALAGNIGAVIILCGIIFVVRGFAAAFGGAWFVLAMALWLCLAGVDVYFISKSDRYKKK